MPASIEPPIGLPDPFRAPLTAPVAGVVLVVEDDEDIRTAVALTLMVEGYRVRTAANGQEALDSIETDPPALILLDLQMPVMNGWELVEQLRERALPVPVVFMTAGHHARTEAERWGVAGFLAKPFDLDQLLNLVERYTHHPQA